MVLNLRCDIKLNQFFTIKLNVDLKSKSFLVFVMNLSKNLLTIFIIIFIKKNIAN